MKYTGTGRLMVILYLVSAAATLSSAGTISLLSQTKTEIHGDDLHVTITATNHGTESAYHVQFRSDALGSITTSPTHENLPVGKSASYSFHRSLKGLGSGRYSCVTKMLYSDANDYPLSALSLTTFVWRQESAPELLSVLNQTAIIDHGKLTLFLKNMSWKARHLTVHLFLPQELSSDLATFPITLPAMSEQKVPLSIRNVSSLAGSTYLTYAVVEFNENGLHFALPAKGLVRILADSRGRYWNDNMFLLGAVLLIGAIVFINIRGFWKKS